MNHPQTVWGMPPSIVAALAAAPGARPGLKLMAAMISNRAQIHAERVRTVNDMRLRSANPKATPTDAARRQRVALMNLKNRN